VTRLLGDEGEHDEAKVAVFQEPADAAAAMATMAAHTAARAHMAAPRVPAAVLMARAEKMMVSVHIESPLL
jgi:hypothetical protein